MGVDRWALELTDLSYSSAEEGLSNGKAIWVRKLSLPRAAAIARQTGADWRWIFGERVGRHRAV